MLLVAIILCIATEIAFVSAECGVVTKQQWDGLSAVHVEYLPRPVQLVIIAHTATQTCGTDKACEDIVRSIQDQHVEGLKYWDIGYNFLVGGNGKVYEGTGWLHVGAHTYGYNRKSIAIALIGNFNTDIPTEAALEAVKALIKCGVQKGHLKSTYNLVGHRQLIAIESPGRKVYNQIRRWQNWLEDVSSIKN